MKKIIVLFLPLLLFLPFHVKALTVTNGSIGSGMPSIHSSSISVPEKVTIGEEFSATFNIQFSGLFKNMPDTFGLLYVAFELQFDDTVFTATNISVNDWITTLSPIEESHLVESVINERNSSNKCIDGKLNCSDYSVTIQFKVNATEQTSSTIKMGDMGAGLLNVDYAEGLSEATDVIEGTSNQSKTITIEKVKETPNEPEKTPTQPTKPSEKPTKPVEPLETPSKANNNYLKTLTIENYKINFLKTKNEYIIPVEKDINQLTIHVETDDPKATYQIIGADNLEQNNHQIQIEVTAENGDKNTYQLKVEPRQDSGLLYENKEKPKNKSFTWKTSYTIICGIIVFLLIITLVITKIKDKKIDKGLDEL